MKIALSQKSTALALLGVVILSTSCSPTKDKKAAEDAVTKFHAQLNSEQYHDIYSHASDEFKKSDSEANIAEFLAAVHHKLGNAANSTERTFFVNFTTSGTVVTLTYQTDFDGGSASEQFSWRVRDEAILVNYRIDSRALIVH
jgi:hypothetical protein